MVDNIGVAQARILLAALDEQVDEISRELEAIERRGHRMSIRGATLDRRCEAERRRDLYEAYRLIGGLHRRFPETARPPAVHATGPGTHHHVSTPIPTERSSLPGPHQVVANAGPPSTAASCFG